ncbi:uncharacterized protein LOC119681339 [Teleopsis dalmanni]|uniref:uncharacterized protein LOC119681339 n=1 Tax=Teleopsis dalmanni TaxID=139649 RepID=UPI0018CECC59|nr:uncharacterized protein LOC119681339 [Teleopsis dalmanni]XP_037950429.1 uncharacterized protein LOC119681339 [Teleopsis dalmanni]XP_037950430.1 uncharacterized protein LOC119681339 [Teleopsis dalmanni]
MEALPTDVLFTIFDRLQLKNVVRLRATSKQMKDAADIYICHQFAVIKKNIKKAVDKRLIPTYIVYIALDRILKDMSQKTGFYLTIIGNLQKIPSCMDINCCMNTMLRLRDRMSGGVKIKLTEEIRLNLMFYHAAIYNLITIWLKHYEVSHTVNNKSVYHKYEVKKRSSEMRVNVYKTELSEILRTLVIKSGYTRTRFQEILSMTEVDYRDNITIILTATEGIQNFFNGTVSKQNEAIPELSQTKGKNFKISYSFDFFSRYAIYNEVYTYNLTGKHQYFH